MTTLPQADLRTVRGESLGIRVNGESNRVDEAHRHHYIITNRPLVLVDIPIIIRIIKSIAHTFSQLL